MSFVNTNFRRWRERLGLTQEQAAQALGISVESVRIYDAGVMRGKRRGDRVVPPEPIRMLMRLKADGITVEPWPE